MDILDLISHMKDTLDSILINDYTTSISENFDDYKVTVLTSVGCCILFILVTVYVLRKWKHKDIIPVKVKEFVGVGTHPRFRKRDKVLFYGRKMLRKVKLISGQVHKEKKRKLVMRFARKILRLKKDTSSTQLQVLEPPSEYLEEDVTFKYDQNLPPDALYLLQSLRVFGHFEKPVFLTLCRHTDILTVLAGSYLFKIGDQDDNVYVVQSGSLNVFITENNGSTISLKHVKAGESVTSLLSYTDVLMNSSSVYKTVSARALEDSTIVRLPIKAFQEVFQDYPEVFIRVMQVIMVRLQRVTFTALHQYLGLTAELIKPSCQASQSQHSHTHHKHHHKSRRGSTSPDRAPDSPEKSRVSFLQDFSKMPSSLNTKSSRTSNNFEEELEVANDSTPVMNEDPPRVYKRSRSGVEIVTSLKIPENSFQKLDGRQSSSVRKKREPPDLDSMMDLAINAFVKELGLENDTCLKDGKLEIKDVPAGTYLMRQDSNKVGPINVAYSIRPVSCEDVALVYLLSGALVVSQKMTDNEQEVHMFTAHPGEMVGGLAVLTGEPSFFTIKARHSSIIAILSKDIFYEIMVDRPQVVLHVAHAVVKRLSPFVRQVDFALDWLFIESGRAVYRQDTESDSTFIVLSGRLRSVITHPDGKKELVGEYGKGDLVGIVEMVTRTPRSTTVMAVRDSELAKLPEGLFNAIKLRFPIVVTRLINLLGHRILGSIHSGINPVTDSRPSQVNFSTVAIVPVSEDVPLTAFGLELYHALCAIGLTLRLTSDMVKKHLGTAVMDPNNEYRLTSWLAQQEDQHKIALYQCDHVFTAWTQRCVRQADCILIVGLAEKGPAIGKIEKQLETLAMRTQRELVLLHREGASKPKDTVAWLNARSWVSSHHHIQCNKRMFSKRSQYRINELYKKVLTSEPNVHSDFSRLARWLTGTSVGLVLGGGGARGAAHIGMIKAIQEANIPIDMVGGVSIGSFIGGLWCMEKDVTTVTQKAREWSKKMTNYFRQLLDVTWPVVSLFTGKDFNSTLVGIFGDIRIEDLWLPYFNITTDITSSSMRVHKHGGLWRYCRASMSLSGYMPPLCDPSDGHLLLDGGYVNNLPADVMRSQGARHILAIDVGSSDDTDLTNYGDSLSGLWLLWKRWNPFAEPVKIPDLSDIQSRLSYVSCVRQLEEVKNSDYCEYIRPPVDKYKTLSFGLFDEIKEVGYTHGKLYFENRLKEGILPLFKPTNSFREKPFTSAASYTFTDLAQMVCKVPRRNLSYDEDSSSSTDSEFEEDEEDMQVGYASEPSSNILKTSSPSKDSVRRGVSLSENELDADITFIRNKTKTQDDR